MARCTDTERSYLDNLFNDETAKQDLEEKLLEERITKRMREEYSNAYLKWKIANSELKQAESAIYSVCPDKRAAKLLRLIEAKHES